VGCLQHVICHHVSQIIRILGVDGLASTTTFCEAACHDAIVQGVPRSLHGVICLPNTAHLNATVLGVFRYLHGMIR